MKKFFLLLLVLASLMGTSTTVTSCSSNDKKAPMLGKSQSAPYEMLLVANKEWLNTMAGQALSVVLNSPIEGLPQAEPHFRLTKINPAAFDGTFRFYANVIVVKIGKDYPEPKVRMVEDAYCRPQLILYLEAPDDNSFITLVRERAELILSMFDAREIARERSLLKKTYSGKVQKQAKQQFCTDIKVPLDIDDIKKGKDFFWASDSKNEFRSNICMYTLPLKDMSLNDFVAARDSVMKINIPGDKENQWMETDSRTVTFKATELEGSSIPVIQVRGLWDMRNDAMGGPFVSYVYTDNANSRLLVVEGFVFAPTETKRAIIRPLEAALQTVILPEMQPNTQE